MSDVWILGATGRSGRAVAAHLAAAGLSPVLVGRDATRRAYATSPRQLVRICRLSWLARSTLWLAK